MKTLIPYLPEQILQALSSSQDDTQDSHLDNLLFRSLMTAQANELLLHMDTIEKILYKVMELKDHKSHMMACTILKCLLVFLLCSVLKLLSVEKHLDDQDYSYWKDWDESIDIHLAKIFFINILSLLSFVPKTLSKQKIHHLGEHLIVFSNKIQLFKFVYAFLTNFNFTNSALRLTENKVTGDYIFTRHLFREQIDCQHQIHKPHFVHNFCLQKLIMMLTRSV